MKIIKTTLDLHGLAHREVKRFLEWQINNMWGKDIDVTIITGHSSRMRSIVVEVLKEYKLEYEIGGYLQLDDSFIKTTI